MPRRMASLLLILALWAALAMVVLQEIFLPLGILLDPAGRRQPRLAIAAQSQKACDGHESQRDLIEATPDDRQTIGSWHSSTDLS